MEEHKKSVGRRRKATYRNSNKEKD
jgi:hypothetical protein